MLQYRSMPVDAIEDYTISSMIYGLVAEFEKKEGNRYTDLHISRRGDKIVARKYEGNSRVQTGERYMDPTWMINKYYRNDFTPFLGQTPDNQIK